MKNIILFIWITVFSLFVLNKNSAQYSDIGIGLGAATYWGDLNAPSFTSNLFNNSGLAIQLHGRYMLGKRLGARASFVYGRFRGEDRHSDLQWQLQRNLSFKSSIKELAVMGELYILSFDTEPGSRFFAPYLTAGIAAFWFDPKTTYQGREVRLQPLGTEGQGLPGRPDKYKLNGFSIPFGVGSKFILTETINLGVEVVIRRSFTDYIDDLSTVYTNYDELNELSGTLTANLANRMNEYLGQEEPIRLPTGSQRGGAKVDDYYIMTMVTLNFMFTDGKGKRRFAKSNKVVCPTFK
jgi:opacity protein-like surface antigen